MTRRRFLAAVGVASASGLTSFAHETDRPLSLTVAVRSPWMANQVALTSDNVLFLGLPRYAHDKPTPSLARRQPDGSLVPFPGNSWNDWKPGDDGREAFVYLNSVHIFADDTVWCVDQGSLSANVFGEEYATPRPGAQKVVQLDPRSGAVLRILRFDETILPPGAQMNDLRFHGSRMYITDSGLGGILVHDLATGKTLRRLSGDTVVKASPTQVPAILAHIKGGQTFHPPNSDLIEITADGKWLYWASPTGPLYRVETRYLNDEALANHELAEHVERVYQNNFSGGCSMDSKGNVYFSETITQHITVLAPSGKTAVLASDPTLVRPDGSFLSRDRRLYIPIKQPVAPGPSEDGKAAAEAPFVTYSIALPERFAGIALGGPVTGR
ncbi:L-dopachrome tautomerase-related protein [Silvibacterium sp.]|uniref:L-dopachrome tautomerase-related protein n=1 Tax=Silvibacterium sp. TaxID=1964179 RepID=UPI0039E710F8